MKALLLAFVFLAGCTTPAPATPPAEAATLACDPCDVRLGASLTWEPSGAMDPTDSDHYVVAFRASDLTIEVHTTFDGGHNWTRSLIPLEATGASAEWTVTGDAVTFFAPDGTLYVGGLGARYEADIGGGISRRSGADIFVARSPDGGLSFDRPVVVAAGAGAQYNHETVRYGDSYRNQDRPWFAAGQGGRLVAAWNELGHDGPYPVVGGVAPISYDGNVFQVAVSVDAGATWSPPQTITHSGWPGALVRADGSFVVAHSSHQTGVLSVGRSADGGDWQWEKVGPLLGQPILRERDGWLLLAGTSPFQGGKAPSYFRETASGWQGPYIFGEAQQDDPFTNMVVHDGAIWFSWYGQNETGSYHLAAVPDGDGVWPAVRHVVATGFDARLPIYGDYVDTLGAGDKVYTAWGAQVEGERPIRVAVHSWTT